MKSHPNIQNLIRIFQLPTEFLESYHNIWDSTLYGRLTEKKRILMVKISGFFSGIFSSLLESLLGISTECLELNLIFEIVM